jgi:restriction system protein
MSKKADLDRLAARSSEAPPKSYPLTPERLAGFAEEGSTEGSFLILPLVTPELLDAIKTDPELLRTVDGRSFERILAELLERQGYQVELQRGTKDGGIDIFALLRTGPMGPHRYLVQAKRWTNAVGVAPVRELMFLHSRHHVTKSCLVTTSRFTKGAWKLAEDYRWQLELRDFESLQEWIAKALHG